jgi:excisionase family DNA binding protein
VNFEASFATNGSVAPMPFAVGAVPFEHRMLTKQETAEYFRVEERTIETWMKARLIPYIRIGHTVRFRMSDLLLELDQRFRVHSKRRVP